MLRKMISIAYKEFRLWLQSPGNWLTVFLVPFAFIGIFGATFNQGTPVVTVFAVNEDKGEFGEEIMTLLEKSDNLELEMIATREEADELVNKGSRMAAIVIPEDFSASVTTSPSKPSSSAMAWRSRLMVEPASAPEPSVTSARRRRISFL